MKRSAVFVRAAARIYQPYSAEPKTRHSRSARRLLINAYNKLQRELRQTCTLHEPSSTQREVSWASRRQLLGLVCLLPVLRAMTYRLGQAPRLRRQLTSGICQKVIARIQTAVNGLLAYNMWNIFQMYPSRMISSHRETQTAFLSQRNQFMAKRLLYIFDLSS